MITDQLLEDSTANGWPFKVVLGYLLSGVIGMLSAFLGAYGGWFFMETEEGLWPVFYGVCGFFVGFAITFYVSGVWSYHFHTLRVLCAPPEYDRIKTTGLNDFDMYVTVHRIQNESHLEDPFGFFGTKGNRQMYVEVKVGRLIGGDASDAFSVQKNPQKRTCISPDNEFEETFQFTIAPTDDTMRITLKDQDILFDDELGFADIDITDQVLKEGFPQKRCFELYVGSYSKVSYRNAQQLAGNVVVSFAPGANLSKRAEMGLFDKNQYALKRLKQERTQILNTTRQEYQAYGATLTNLHTDQNV